MKRPKQRTVRLDEIVIDQRAQTRADGLDDAHVEQMVEDLKALPAMLVVEVDGKLRLADGFHRYAAFKRAKVLRVPVAVIVGTEDDWVDAFASANDAQKGKPRTREDKRNAVRRCLEVRPKWSNVRIAEAAKVDEKTVRKVRADLPQVRISEPDGPEKREGKDGKEYPAAKPKPKTEQPVAADEPRPGISPAEYVKAPDPPPAPPAPEPKPKADPKPAKKEGGEKPAPAEPPAQVDAWGIPIQPHAAEAFEALPQFAELIAALTRAQRQYSQLALTPGGVFLHKKSVFLRGEKQDDGTHKDRIVHAGIDEAIKALKVSRPTHTVCPWHYVDGPHPDDCHTCRGMNWTPELGKQIPQAAVDRAKEAHRV